MSEFDVMKKKIIKTVVRDDFRLLAVAGSVKDYQLAWSLNKRYGLEIGRVKDHEVEFKNKSKLINSKHHFENEYLSITILENKCIGDSSERYMLPELKNLDFFILISDETREFEILNVKSTLSEINNVILVQELSIDKVKSIDNLLSQ